MKKLCYALFFLLLTLKSFSQETEKLPKIPWVEIVELSNEYNRPIRKWKQDIRVNLEGNYTRKDSLYIEKAINKLDFSTETISIKFSNTKNFNLKINFLDTINPRGNSKIVWRYMLGNKQAVVDATITVYNKENSNLSFEASILTEIAKLLVTDSFNYSLSKTKRASIFNPYKSSNIVGDQDIAIIKEVYKPDFEKKLGIAEEQFKYVIDDLYVQKVKVRDRNLWWVQNPVALIFLPVLFLSLFFIFLISKIKKSIDVKIKRDWLRFGVIALVSLFFMNIVIILCVSFCDFLIIADDYGKASIIRLDTVLSTTVFLFVVLFPLLYLFRFIEIKIQKTLKSIFTKTALIFLSTGFLPFICTVLLFVVMSNINNANIQGGYLTLSKIFLFLMAIASIRSLISFFIFKERNLIIENETKLSNLRELKTKAELKSLQSQINPHFLYNALNSIASLAQTNADKTEKMALSLSDLFKYTINRKGKKTSTINDELEMVRSYLEIEQTRFGDRLAFTINAEEDVLNEEIPMYILQPLVENAVKHGISKIEDKGIIKLTILKTEQGLEIEVIDNGPDFPEGLVSGHGLQTVYDLLRLSYGDKAELKWQNTPQKSIGISIDKTA